jgi:hypothetical protein
MAVEARNMGEQGGGEIKCKVYITHSPSGCRTLSGAGARERGATMHDGSAHNKARSDVPPPPGTLPTPLLRNACIIAVLKGVPQYLDCFPAGYLVHSLYTPWAFHLPLVCSSCARAPEGAP